MDWLHKFHDPVQIKRYELEAQFCQDQLDDVGIVQLRQYLILLSNFKVMGLQVFDGDGAPLKKRAICALLSSAGQQRLIKSYTKFAVKLVTVYDLSLGLWALINFIDVVRGKDKKKFEKVEKELNVIDLKMRDTDVKISKSKSKDLKTVRKKLLRDPEFNILWLVRPDGEVRVSINEINKATEFYTKKQINSFKKKL